MRTLSHNHHQPAALRSQGFTLIEILVAVSIFAIMSVIAYGGLDQILRNRERIEAQADRMGEIQKAFLLIERDLEQTASRPIRDAYGSTRGAFLREKTDTQLMEFTRAGWLNPLDRPRSSLQRVQYQLDADHQLVRLVWWVLDQAQDTQPEKLAILTNVTNVEIRLLSWDDKWSEEWPSSDSAISGTSQPKLLPKAVEITVETEDLGKIRRLFVLPRGVTSIAPPSGGPQ